MTRLMLIEWDLSEANLPSRGKFADVTMMVTPLVGVTFRKGLVAKSRCWSTVASGAAQTFSK